MEKSWIEKLSEYAECKGYEYWSHKSMSSGGFVRNVITSTKYFMMVIKNDAHTYYYCASADHSGSISTNGSFSGVFRVFSDRKLADLKIRRRFWIDRIFSANRQKIGIPTIDKKLFLQCADKELASRIASSRLGHSFLKISKRVTPLEIIVEPNRMKFNGNFKKKSIMGIRSNRWVTDTKELNHLIDSGINLLNSIPNKR